MISYLYILKLIKVLMDWIKWPNNIEKIDFPEQEIYWETVSKNKDVILSKLDKTEIDEMRKNYLLNGRYVVEETFNELLNLAKNLNFDSNNELHSIFMDLLYTQEPHDSLTSDLHKLKYLDIDTLIELISIIHNKTRNEVYDEYITNYIENNLDDSANELLKYDLEPRY